VKGDAVLVMEDGVLKEGGSGFESGKGECMLLVSVVVTLF